MDNNFKLYSSYYDLLYKSKDYQSEVEYVQRLINKHAPNATSIIELGCGTGKHAVLLADRGFAVLGVDRSTEMINVAIKSSSEKVAFEVGDVVSFQSDRQFDVA